MPKPTSPPLSYEFAVMQEQADELFTLLAALCADRPAGEVTAACCEIVCRGIMSMSRAPHGGRKAARVLRTAFVETLQELEL